VSDEKKIKHFKYLAFVTLQSSHSKLPKHKIAILAPSCPHFNCIYGTFILLLNIPRFRLLSLFQSLKMNFIPPHLILGLPDLSCTLVRILGLTVVVQCFSFFLHIFTSHFGILQFLKLYFLFGLLQFLCFFV